MRVRTAFLGEGDSGRVIEPIVNIDGGYQMYTIAENPCQGRGSPKSSLKGVAPCATLLT